MAYDLKYGRVTTEKGNHDEDEPVLVFRAQDRMLLPLLKIYKVLCQAGGSPGWHIQAIDAAALAIKQWQANHPDRVKVPTSDSLNPFA